NAESAEHVLPWLPSGTGGHVIITTRAGAWHEISLPALEVPQFSRTESVCMLRQRLAHLNETEADLLARELGDLPLAIAQAACFMTESGMPAADYLALLRTRAGEILRQGQVSYYPDSLASIIRLA